MTQELIAAARLNVQKATEHFKASQTQLETAKASLHSAKSLLELLESASGSHSGLDRNWMHKLCARCQKIPLEKIFLHQGVSAQNLANGKRKREPIVDQRHKIGDLLDIIQSQQTCTLCRFLADAVQLARSDNTFRIRDRRPQSSALYLFSSSIPWFRTAGINTNQEPCPFAWLQIGSPTKTGEPHICISFEPKTTSTQNDSEPSPLPNRIYPTRRRPFEAFSGNIDVELIKAWLVKCDTRHGKKCSKEDLPSIQDISLIDVETRKIVPYIPGVEYVTLSYVWGKQLLDQAYFQTTTTPISDRLPPETPATIEDAIRLTKMLGRRYLWVDMFCIAQFDNVKKEHQINTMHHIFSSAWLTLVCLDGPHASTGFPGLSRPFQRMKQPEVLLDYGRLRATYVHSLWDHNGQSVWDKRAWTLQERLLSRRCLIFSDTYVSMLCRSEFFHDLVSTNLQATGVRSFLDDSYFREDGSGIDLDKEHWDFHQYGALVSVFTGRKITDEDDRPNACQGALNKMTAKTKCEFFHGIPREDLAESLLWKPFEECVVLRRPLSPSWSWFGWKGRVEFNYWLEDRTVHNRWIVEHGDEDDDSQELQRSSFVTDHIEHVRFKNIGSLSKGDTVLQLSTTICTFKLRFLRSHGTLHKQRSSKSQYPMHAVGDHWALLDKNEKMIFNDIGEFQRFERTDVTLRLAPEYTRLLIDQEYQADFIFVKFWPEIWDSVQNQKTHSSNAVSVQTGRTLSDVVSALLVIKNEDGTYWRLASVTIPASVWMRQNPKPVDIALT